MLSKFNLFPVEASTVARQVDALFLFLCGMSLFFSLLIAFTIVAFAIKYRRRSPDEMPRPIHGSLMLELVWSIIPFGISMFVFFWSASIYLTLSRPPDDALEIFAVGKQWMWKLQHMEGRREINELHVPVGRPIKLTMTSEDVIHSFYVPAFRIKADVVPGRYTTTWFEPTRTGTYHLFCAEYCGTAHSGMIGRVVVVEQAEYQSWLAGGGTVIPIGQNAAAISGVASVQSAGEAVFRQKGCITCHQNVSGALGPSLAGIYGKPQQLEGGRAVVVDDAYLRESILNPQAKIVAGYKPLMPTFQGLVGEEEILQVIQYIRSLAAPEVGGASAPAVPEGDS